MPNMKSSRSCLWLFIIGVLGFIVYCGANYILQRYYAHDSSQDIVTIYEAPTAPAAPTQRVRVNAADAISYDRLLWTHGDFAAPHAVMQDVYISNAQLRGMQISFARLYGSTSGFGDTTVCLFYQSADRTWRGGKVTTIADGAFNADASSLYNASTWADDDFTYALEYALVLVSADGTKRSNVTMVYP